MSSTKRRGRGQRSSWSSSRAGSRGRKSNEGLGAAGKFTFASRVCAVGKFPPSPQGQVGFWLKQSSLHRARSSVCMQALGPYRSQRATPCVPLPGGRLGSADPLGNSRGVSARTRSLHRTAFRSVTKLWDKYCLHCGRVQPWPAAPPSLSRDPWPRQGKTENQGSG